MLVWNREFTPSARRVCILGSYCILCQYISFQMSKRIIFLEAIASLALDPGNSLSLLLSQSLTLTYFHFIGVYGVWTLVNI